jgi:hypothetical protein
MFLPGAVKYGDLPGLLSLASPARFWLAGEGGEPPAPIGEVFQAAGVQDRLQVYDGDPAKTVEAAVSWLLQP